MTWRHTRSLYTPAICYLIVIKTAKWICEWTEIFFVVKMLVWTSFWTKGFFQGCFFRADHVHAISAARAHPAPMMVRPCWSQTDSRPDETCLLHRHTSKAFTTFDGKNIHIYINLRYTHPAGLKVTGCRCRYCRYIVQSSASGFI